MDLNTWNAKYILANMAFRGILIIFSILTRQLDYKAWVILEEGHSGKGRCIELTELMQGCYAFARCEEAPDISR